jgi:peptidyl-tRNA hydrolase
MANTRLVVVLRKDLKMVEGLAIAQGIHAAMQFIQEKVDAQDRMSELSQIEKEWIKDPYISVLAVNCSEDLQGIIAQAEENGLPCTTWQDTIPSPTFPERNIKVTTGIGIGPGDFDKIKIVTGSLALY